MTQDEQIKCLEAKVTHLERELENEKESNEIYIKGLETQLVKLEEEKMRYFNESREERSKRYKYESAFEALVEFMLKKK